MNIFDLRCVIIPLCVKKCDGIAKMAVDVALA